MVADGGTGVEVTADRRQFLVHIDAELIRRTKILAIELDTTASSIVQQALTEFFARQTPASPSAARSETSS